MSMPAAIGIALLPYATFRAGTLLLGLLSGWKDRQEVARRLKGLDKADRKPLNQRIQGYDRPAVRRFWGALALDPDLLPSEERSLRLDLFFPLLYGAAFTASLLLAWRDRERSWAFAGLLIPVAIYMAADWTENLAQLKQLRLYRQKGPNALQPSGIRVASRATSVKLLFFVGCLLLVVFVLWKNSPK